MNKYEIILNMFKNKILFIFKRCEYNNNKILITKNLSFLPTTSSIIITRPFKPTFKNESNKDNFNINHLKDISNKKRSILTLKTLKKKMIKKSNLIDITKIDALIYYHLTRNKKNKLFSLTMNEIYDTSCEPSSTKTIQKNNRIPLNKSCSCDSENKYKKCCESYTLKTVQINNVKVLILQKMLNKLSVNYHNYANVFNKSKTNMLPPHRFYNHKLEFAENINKNALFKNRIYSLSNHKLEQIKKYLNKHLRKGFIVSNHTPFASPILFTKKPNEELRFYIDYKKLNAIIKRNRYSIPLINEILIKIQGCKYLTRLNIIAVFNKLRIHPNNEDFTTFVIFLKTYKYRILSFKLTNDLIIYQQYINDIFFKYLNDFYQAYLNNILIYNKTKKDHIKHIRLILQKLREIDLQMNILKCEFHVQKIKFLNLLMSIDELRMDSTKIQTIVD